MSDLTFNFGSFNDTTVEVGFATEAGKAFLQSMFGDAVHSVNLPKSRAEDFYRFCQQKGIKV